MADQSPDGRLHAAGAVPASPPGRRQAQHRRISRCSAALARAGPHLSAPVDRAALRHARAGPRVDGRTRNRLLRKHSSINAQEAMMATTIAERSLAERAIEVLRRAGNPFRNYFARNPDDDVCAQYHVPELFAKE